MPGLQQLAVVFAVTAVVIGAILARSVIMVREGYVGVIYRFGKLSDGESTECDAGEGNGNGRWCC